MAQPEPGDVTRLLQSWSGGDKEALGELVPFVYRELRGLAAAYIRRERRDHTLQPTALVHEAYGAGRPSSIFLRPSPCKDNETTGHGFVYSEGGDCFFHTSSAIGPEPATGDSVEFC